VKTLVGRFLGTLVLLATASAALAQATGMLDLVSGDASYSSGNARGKAAPYMKVEEGDRLILAANARLRVVYFSGGRQETYIGPARFTVGRTASRQEAGASAQVALLPAAISQKIERIPELVALARLGAPGGTVVRGARHHADERELAAAREGYERLRASAAADDILPELYLYAVLRDAQRYDELDPLVEEMQRRRPSDEAVRLLRR